MEIDMKISQELKERLENAARELVAKSLDEVVVNEGTRFVLVAKDSTAHKNREGKVQYFGNFDFEGREYILFAS